MSTDQTDFMGERKGYDDADLYRILVARNLLDGYCANKSEFDAMVRSMGDLAAADKLIAFRDQRPSCIATEFADGFSCACGIKWSHNDLNPPCCQFDQLR